MRTIGNSYEINELYSYDVLTRAMDRTPIGIIIIIAMNLEQGHEQIDETRVIRLLTYFIKDHAY